MEREDEYQKSHNVDEGGIYVRGLNRSSKKKAKIMHAVDKI